MPRVSYSQQPVNAGEDRFPKYKLEKGEKSRAWLPEEPWMEWYHRIEAPLVENGEIVMEVRDTKRGPVEVMKMDWIGSAFCLGETGTPDNPGPLMLAGIDPDNCPVCESAANGTGVNPPVQRFAANIIKYKVRGRGTNPYELATPISAEILVWAYTARIHGTLYELGTEHGDLRKHDIKIELEDSPGADKYQKIKTLSIIVEPAYKNSKVREYVTALWRDPENRATDEQLRDACQGRDYVRPVLLDMVRRAERQWRDSERGGASGGDAGAADAAFNGDLNEGIGALLDAGQPKDPWADELAGHPGGTEEFMSAEQRDTIAEAKRQAQREIAAIVSPDPLAAGTGIDSLPGQVPMDPAQNGTPGIDETPTVPGATTTRTAAPAAESRSRTEPKSAQSAGSSEGAAQRQAVEQAADDMFGESGNGAAAPEPAKPVRQRKAKAEEPKPEPAAVPAGGVIDFDDLFKD